MRQTSQRRIDPRRGAWARRGGFLSFYYRSRVRADSQKGRILVLSQSKRRESVRKFPRTEIIHAMPDAAKRLCEYLRNFVPTTATNSLGQSDFGKKWVGNDVTAELDRFTYLFYGRTTADYERDHKEAMARWLYPVEGWIIATPTEEEREELAKCGDCVQVMHNTYAAWPNQVTRCIDSLTIINGFVAVNGCSIDG